MKKFKVKKNVLNFVDKVKDLVNSKNYTIENIFHLIIENGKNKTVFLFDETGIEKKISYYEFEKLVDVYSDKIHSSFKGLSEGDVVGLKLPNSKDWVISYFAILKAGFKPLFLNPKISKEETLFLIKETSCKGMISYEKEEFNITSLTLNEILKCENTIPNTYNFQNEIIFCSSGTTGKSKVFVFDGKSLVANLETSLCMPLETNDILYENKNDSLRILGLAPFFHIFGFIAVLNWYLFYSGTIVFPNSLSFESIKETIKSKKVTHVYFVPLFFDNLAKQLSYKIERLPKVQKEKFYTKLEKTISKNSISFFDRKYFRKIREDLLGNQIKYLISGGGTSLDSTMKLLNGIGYTLCNGFGMTELGVTSVELSSSIQDRIKNSIGHALPPIKYSLVPTKENQNNSELYVETKTAHIKKFENGELILNDLEKPFPTGDLATIDKDGRVYIKGRIKDIIISSKGENISPDEIETYFSNIPNVEEYSIFGGSEKNSNVEKVVLALKPKENISDEDYKKIKKILNKINDDISPLKKVEEFLVIKTSFPKPNNLKISRTKLKELYQNKNENFYSLQEARHIDSFEGFSNEEIRKLADDLRKTFASFLQSTTDNIKDDSHWMNDLGGNSLNYMDLIMDIQKSYDIVIPQEKYGTYTTINDFVVEILRQRNKKV